jgi:hypothetical protein
MISGKPQRAGRRSGVEPDDQDHCGPGRTAVSAPAFSQGDHAVQKFYAHDEKREAQVGDRVRIRETRPLSKTKNWRLVAIVERGGAATATEA